MKITGIGFILTPTGEGSRFFALLSPITRVAYRKGPYSLLEDYPVHESSSTSRYGVSSSEEVAELLNVCWLDITGKMEVKKLRHKTSYSAYMVFKLQEESNGLEKATASVRLVKEISEGSDNEGYTVFIDTKELRDERKRGRYPHERRDEWMEIKLGEFFNELGDDGDLEMRLFETINLNWKSGLLLRGFDIRPN